ncbi:MAG: DEAD/DEAH box helicase, partial [Bacteroidales bacterium]|nr:DEAD/DEAH box helicase [Bacteroidales bacterium]
MTFEELGIEGRLLKAITEMGFEKPMPVQEQVLPLLLTQTTDLVALAQTGTGKTAAFGLPAIQRLDISTSQTEVLILSPTRELCLQIAKDLKLYSKYVQGCSVVAVYGGASIEMQKKDLKNGAKIVVATPGRIHDMVRRHYVDLSQVKVVVLDEADEMLDMGFKDDLDAILEQTPATKNTWLFSATMPDEVARIAKGYMNNPQEITVGTRNSGAQNVKHCYYLVQAKDRYLALKRIADYYPNIYAIIFCRTRTETQE